MAITSVIAGTTGTFGATAPSVTAMLGTYSIYSTWNSASQYSNSVDYIGFNGLTWVWSSAPNGGGTVYATNSSASTTIPTSGWSGSGNPTLAALTTGLAISYTAYGAGTTSANGTYLPVSGAYATYNGVTHYSNGTNCLAWASNQWYLFPTVNVSGSSALYAPGPSLGTVFPLTGWLTVTGFGSPPSWTPPSNGNFFYMF